MQEKRIKEDVPDYIGHRQRLRERFMSDVGRSMPDYELLELVLTYALPRKDVKPLAKMLLRQFPNLASVIAASVADLKQIKGVGDNVIALLKLIQACSNKICWEHLEAKDAPILTDKSRIVEYCRSCIGHATQENLLIIYLNIHGKFISQKIEQVGTLDAVMISPRAIVESALANKASAIIMVHNHPSGSSMPSKADIEMTRRVKEALKTVSIRLEDHLIITSGKYYSMREHLPFMII